MQFSLFGKRPLFDAITLERRRVEWRQNPIFGLNEFSRKTIEFAREIKLRSGKKKEKETSLEQEFNQAFFVSLLGYQLFPGTNKSWTAWPKAPSAATGLTGEPDLLLGSVGEAGFNTAAVVELKKPGTLLDAPQPAYSNRTPVEQAFGYARKLATCRWVIVSDMRLVRLYSIESQDACHELDLWAGDAQDDDRTIAEAVSLLSFDNLIKDGSDSPTSRLLASARDEQASFRDGFYKLYSDIRGDLLSSITQWAAGRFDQRSIVLAVQRLLDRLLFIYFCEDHPDRLLQHGLIEDIVEGALRQPGPSNSKAYDSLKQLFRDLDQGVSTSHWSIPRYNGELFKEHDIIDSLALDDSWQSKRYTWAPRRGESQRVVKGVFGLHIFDFWRELDRDLLGNVFERSIGDLSALAVGGRPDARKAFGVFYTASRLAKFVARSAVEATLSQNKLLAAALEKAGKAKASDRDAAVDEIANLLGRYRIADLACGSGVFLTAALDSLLQPYRKSLEAVKAGNITREIYGFRQSEILKSTIFGVDLLPQAVELSKLSLWLTAARRNEPSAELTSNFVTGDALNKSTVSSLVANAGGAFDLIVGNPPWGAEYEPLLASKLAREVGMPEDGGFDSWEVFIALVMSALKPGGRFALLVPDTFFSAEKVRTRRWLLDNTQLEKIYSLGPDWFTEDVRMGTVLLQGTKRAPVADATIQTLVVAGSERHDAQNGIRPLEQLEEVGSNWAPQGRSREDQQARIRVLASADEIDLIRRIESRSRPLAELTEHARGDEINADGLLWKCGGCSAFTVPGEKRKGGGFKDKICPSCGATLSTRDLYSEALVSQTKYGHYSSPYIDGAALTGRYDDPVRRFMRTDLAPIFPPLKGSQIFGGPKILIRQAGVGIAATLIADNSRCPQSIYIYRVTDAAREEGYTNEFILGCLVSRTVNYLSMQSSAEIDPARAFAKLTHARLGALPIPKLVTPQDRSVASQVAVLVSQMLTSPEPGGVDDMRIETMLRKLWGISGDEGRFINGFFSLVEGQAVSDLFPNGAPPRVPFPKGGSARGN